MCTTVYLLGCSVSAPTLLALVGGKVVKVGVQMGAQAWRGHAGSLGRTLKRRPPQLLFPFFSPPWCLRRGPKEVSPTDIQASKNMLHVSLPMRRRQELKARRTGQRQAQCETTGSEIKETARVPRVPSWERAKTMVSLRPLTEQDLLTISKNYCFLFDTCYKSTHNILVNYEPR